jgi:acetyl-CoA/propionyl-CoA carboxylase biotin carboxyl carrier protein
VAVWELREIDRWEAARGGGDAATDGVAASGHLRAPMPGTVTAVKVAVGDHVTAGQTLVVMEAMKMEHLITAPTEGIVATLRARPGMTVPLGDILGLVTPVAPTGERGA